MARKPKPAAPARSSEAVLRQTLAAIRDDFDQWLKDEFRMNDSDHQRTSHNLIAQVSASVNRVLGGKP